MQELEGLEIEFAFDGDTQKIDDNPIIVFGESYSGDILLRNANHYQYIILDVAADDADMKLAPMQEKYVMPGETRILHFDIETSKSRKRPFKLGVSCRGGFVI